MKKTNIYRLRFLVVFLFFLTTFLYSQYGNVNLDTVRAQKFDLGKMWTFDAPPINYFSEVYNFTPTQEWFDHVRMSALRFADYCSASFVSADGLVMTNHHCGRDAVSQVEVGSEDLHKNGFIALKLEDERKVPDLFVEQLVRIMDVTDEVKSAFESGSTPEEKVALRQKKIDELEKKYSSESGLKCNVVSLYNGGKYSLYFYKTYTDVRLVFAPEDQIGFFGGDPDNFTYPRYNFDCTFFRVYENGKPLKTEHYFKWSSSGAMVGEPIFVVGNPGSTNRLNTISQLEFKRDIEYPDQLDLIEFFLDYFTKLVKENPEFEKFYSNQIFSLANSQKVYRGMIKSLNDPYLMARKKDFEKNFRHNVEANPELNFKYGKIWDEIKKIRTQIREIYPVYASYILDYYSPGYLKLADTLVKLMDKGDKIDTRLLNKYLSNIEITDKLLEYKIKLMEKYLGSDNPIVKKFTNGKTGMDAVNDILSRSFLANSSEARNILEKGKEEILSKKDPFIEFILDTRESLSQTRKLYEKLTKEEELYVQQLGNAIFEVYGTSIPPDATFTLRISDGVIKSYEYNGTITPPKTTFYGLYDRFYSFKKKYPWNLPERWLNPPVEFNLETPFNFISTNDITGGNSGSPVINSKAEIVGLAFDGNIESMPGDFIYLSEIPTTVCVDSQGLIEGIRDLYKFKRLSDELLQGKIVR